MRVKFKWIVVEVAIIFFITTTTLVFFEIIKVKKQQERLITNLYKIECKNTLVAEKSKVNKIKKEESNCIKEQEYDLFNKQIKMQKISKNELNKNKQKSNTNKILKKSIARFITPTNGQLTSRYGPRRGSFHTGIDLASRVGTTIKASESGTVVFAGYKGSYGYMVELCHTDGYNTRYAHCSKLYVKVGEKVNKNEKIAAVGNTGRSTGPHVHFEILKHGKHQNPLKYIK